MEMRLSLHEVVTKCTQALRALNVPPGLDIENGRNIGWLANHGLPGLQILVEEIKTPSDTLSRNPIEINMMKDTVEFFNQELSAFYLAQSAVDFAENGKIVSIKNCRFPLLIFAEMARREHLNCGFKIDWTYEGKTNTGLSSTGKAAIKINSKGPGIGEDIELIAIGTQSLAGSEKIIDHQTKLVKGGIKCDPHHWETICMTANEMLVPDSKQSHTSAGAEVDDNL